MFPPLCLSFLSRRLLSFLPARKAPLYHADVSGGLLKEMPSACNAKTNARCLASAASYV